MKLWRLKGPALAGILALSLTCDGLDNIAITASGESTIEGSLLGEFLAPFSFFGFDGIDITQSQEFRNQGYTKDQIDSVRIQRFTLTVTSPEDGNFNFLSSIAFFAEADGQEKVEVARLDPVPKGQAELNIEVLDVELRAYAVTESMTITTSATGIPPRENTTVKASVVLDIDVNVGGSLGCRIAGR